MQYFVNSNFHFKLSFYESFRCLFITKLRWLEIEFHCGVHNITRLHATLWFSGLCDFVEWGAEVGRFSKPHEPHYSCVEIHACLMMIILLNMRFSLLKTEILHSILGIDDIKKRLNCGRLRKGLLHPTWTVCLWYFE